jgi:uncharacterized protein YbjT (DUF2867 family)
LIVVTTPTGKIGSQVVKQLVAANESVRVIARDPAKLSPEVLDKVDAVQGSLDDEKVMSRALKGAESLFFVVPPVFNTDDETEYILRFTRPLTSAIKSQHVSRVVSVSALGRGIPVDAGPVTAVFVKDAEIERTGVAYRALWCPSFMENMLGYVQTIKREGVFFLPRRGDLKTRNVATRDIASSGTKLLLDKSWKGQGGLAVLGPEDLSLDHMAAIMTEVIGKPIRYGQISGEAYKAQLLKFGASEAVAQGLTNMMAAKDKGLDNAEPRTPENTTPTSFRQWCQEVLKPAVLG